MSKSTTFRNLHCGHPRCNDRIGLEIVTEHDSHGQTGGHLDAALELAAARIGWRRDVTPLGPLAPGATANVICCPRHAAELECARCRNFDCSCMGGPRFEAMQP